MQVMISRTLSTSECFIQNDVSRAKETAFVFKLLPNLLLRITLHLVSVHTDLLILKRT